MRKILRMGLIILVCTIFSTMQTRHVFAQATPTKIECGTILQAETSTNDQSQNGVRYHTYTLNLKAGDSVTIIATPVGPLPQIKLHLFDPALSMLIDVNWSANGKSDVINSFVVSASGDYTIEVITNVLSAYTLTIGCTLRDGTVIGPGTDTNKATPTPSDKLPTPTSSFSGNGFPGLAPVDFSNIAKFPYALGSSITGGVSKDTAPLGYTFDGAANQIIELSYTKSSGNTNVAIVVLSADNKVIFQTSLVTSNSLTTQFVLPSDGQYTIGVFPIDLLTPDPAQPTAFTITASLSGQASSDPLPTASFAPTVPVAPAASVVAADINGVWAGNLVQTGGGTFNLEFTINQADTIVTGTARISLADKPETFGVIEFTGEWKDGVFTFKESVVKDQNPPKGQWNWCLKTGTLKVSDDGTKLVGTWNATGCGTGTITVSKKA